MSVSGRSKYSTNMADPLIAQHAMHWVLCHEVYSIDRRQDIEGWEFIGGTDDTILYIKDDTWGIVAFRGTHVASDIISDVQLASKKNGTCSFDRAGPGIKLVDDFIRENPDITLQLTGHSLGGAVARCAGEALGLPVVTFNSAAPPSNPVVVGRNEIDYHIVFDLISAWQTPNTIRIDKGYRPARVRSLVPKNFLRQSLAPTFASHSLSNFSNEKVGHVIDAATETKLLLEWNDSLPLSLRLFMAWYLEVRRIPAID